MDRKTPHQIFENYFVTCNLSKIYYNVSTDNDIIGLKSFFMFMPEHKSNDGLTVW